MWRNPVATLFALNQATRRLLLLEIAIRRTRMRVGADQLIQLEMDREQADVEARRAKIEAIKNTIAMSN